MDQLHKRLTRHLHPSLLLLFGGVTLVVALGSGWLYLASTLLAQTQRAAADVGMFWQLFAVFGLGPIVLFAIGYGLLDLYQTRQQAERRQRAAYQDDRFKRLLNQLPRIAVQGYDTHHRVIFWNQASERLYGYAADEAMGQRLEALIIPSAMQPQVYAAIEAWFRDGKPIPAAELTLQAKGGQSVTIYSSHVMQDNAQGQPEMFCVDIDLTELKTAEAAAQQNAEALGQVNRMLLAMRSINQLLVQQHDRQHMLHYVCEQLAGHLGYYAWAALLDDNKRVIEYAVADLTGDWQQPLSAALAAGSLHACGYRALRADQAIWIHDSRKDCQSCPVRGGMPGRPRLACRIAHQDKTYGVIAVAVAQPFSVNHNIGALLQELAADIGLALSHAEARSALMASDERLRNLIETSPIGIFQSSTGGRLLFANPAAADILGLASPSEAIAYFDNLAEQVYADPTRRQDLIHQLQQEGVVKNFEFYSKPLAGNQKWLILNGRLTEGQINGDQIIDGFISDISERKRAEEQLSQLAYCDPLSGLANRWQFRLWVEQAIANTHPQQANLAVLMLDLDRFKHINDSLGHSIGDEVLQQIAARLQRKVGAMPENARVARMGGDEFALIIVADTSTTAIASTTEQIAAALLALINQKLFVAGYEFYLNASIGISLYPRDGTTVEELLRNADAAMYTGKRLAMENSVHFYTASMTDDALARVTLAADLREGIARDELVLVYQPQIALTDGALIGLEALVRWQSPIHGFVSPGRFIPIAEESDLIEVLGTWVLYEACRQGQAWLQAGQAFGRIAVNVSVRQLLRSNFADVVRDCLATTGLAPEHLELEITESMLMSNIEQAIHVLDELSGLGIQCAVDDFGTGYSSLAYLKRLPIHKIKIDRSFIDDVPEDASDVAIVNAIIAMTQSLHYQVIAEGLETSAQRDFLLAAGCHQAQGYFYSKPVPAEQLSLSRPNSAAAYAPQILGV